MIQTARSPWLMLAAVCLALVPAAARAQGQGDLASGRLVFGPLTLRPRLAISNLGLDTNVFNSSSDRQRDFTVTFLPAVDSTLRIGRTRVRATTGLELLYYQKARSQRSAGFVQEGRFEAPLARITAFVTGGRVITHQRPNLEIDERVEQARQSVGLGAEVRVGARTRLTTSLDRQRIEFDQREAGIAQALDRQANTAKVALAVDLTPLTTFVLEGDRHTDRFLRSAFRDSNAIGIVGGFDLEPMALISGRARVGFRRVNALDPRVPDFSGVVAAVRVAYLAREHTRLEVGADRLVDYAIESDQPYFVSLSGELTVTQLVKGRWDAVGRYGRAAMNHRLLTRPDAPATSVGRIDRQILYGVGAGFRVDPATRIGVDLIYQRRLSNLEQRQYEGYRFGGSFTYAY